MQKVKERMRRAMDKEGCDSFVVSYSGGKDSTVLLHLSLELAKEENLKLIVVHSDTLVENPIVHEHAFSTLEKVKDYCYREGVKCEVKVATPDIKYTYWVNLIGKGYPLPSHRFRWCQDKLKIKPVKKVMKEIKDSVMFVGLRSDESHDRARSLKSRSRGDFRLEDNGIPVYAPMMDVSEEEIWEFLSNSEPPYDGSYKDVISIYKEARGECPLIPEKNGYRNGCGMRFGCWVCTLVREDKTLKNQIAFNRELKHLYEFRQFLIDLCNDPESRSGLNRKGEPVGYGKGALKISVRKKILEELLLLEKRLGKKLISSEELGLIKHIWEKDISLFGM